MEKKKNDPLMAEIKKMEKKAREEAIAANPPPPPEVIFFDEWWASRAKQIPAMHRKEVVLADFKARGLKNKEAPEKFDIALKQYGVDLA